MTTTLPTSDTSGWCTIAGTNGRVLRTSSYADSPEGSRFVTVLDDRGDVLGWWPSQSWADPAQAAATMAAIWVTAAAEPVTELAYGTELSWTFPGGTVRACADGSYVRILDADGADLDGGSAYWTTDEWVEDPELVMGAILGAVRGL